MNWTAFLHILLIGNNWTRKGSVDSGDFNSGTSQTEVECVRPHSHEAGKDKQSETAVCQKDEVSFNSEKAEGEQTVLSSANRAAQDTVRDSDEDLMEEEENVFKVPVLKRKQVNNNSGSQDKKGPVTRSEEEEEEEVCPKDSQPQTDSQQSAESQQHEKKYEVEQIKKSCK